jgi:hypothetical protein
VIYVIVRDAMAGYMLFVGMFLKMMKVNLPQTLQSQQNEVSHGKENIGLKKQ